MMVRLRGSVCCSWTIFTALFVVTEYRIMFDVIVEEQSLIRECNCGIIEGSPQ
jgi:hypothetical protein